MTASPSRGLLYPTPPEYDVFKRRSETPEETADETDEPEAPAEPDERPGPAGSANWTGTVPVGD